MSRNNYGCGCFILVALAIVFCVTKCSEPQIEDDHSFEIQEGLSEEDKQYLDNTLITGMAPYTKYYGKNYECPYNQCSGIEVTAPKESDIVVIIKENNKDGKVIQHGYIGAGDSYFFPVPDGVYQTFFYYGKGWNPAKEMKDDIRGGFVKDEIFSKDNPQHIYSAVFTYVLQL